MATPRLEAIPGCTMPAGRVGAASAVPVAARGASTLAWALSWAGWLVLGALGRNALPLWFDGLVPVAAWLALTGAVQALPSGGRVERWIDRHLRATVALAGIGVVAGLVRCAESGSAFAALMVAAGWAVLLASALRIERAARTTARVRAARKVPMAVFESMLPAVGGAALAVCVAGDLGGVFTVLVAVKSATAVGAAAVALWLACPIRAEASTWTSNSAPTSTSPSTPAPTSTPGWTAFAARCTMLPTMAAMAVAGDWCAVGGITAAGGVALHFAAMLLPAVATAAWAAASARFAGTSIRARSPARGTSCVVLAMVAGLVAPMMWPGARGWMAMSLLHAVAWSLVWLQDMRRDARGGGLAPAPSRVGSLLRAAVLSRVAVLAPSLATVALGFVLGTFGAASLVAVHMGLGCVAVVAWVARARR